MEPSETDQTGRIEGSQWAAPMPAQPDGGRPRRLVIAGLVGIATIAIASVAFATMNAGRNNDGAADPEAAMQKFFDGLSSEDLVAAVDAFLPSEADPAIEYTGAIGSELKRLEILSSEVNPQSVAGIDLEFTDLEYRTEEIAPGFVRVSVVNGEAFFDLEPSELPLGDLILNSLPAEARANLEEGIPAQADSMAGAGFSMVAVEEDGGWYLSFWYTVMDAIFSQAGYGTPAFGAGVEAVGAGSPEAAVEAAFRQVLSLDLEGLIGMLPPTEMRALYDYMPLVMSDYNQSVGAFASFVTIDIESLGTSVSDADNGAKRVKIESFDIAFNSLLLEIDGAISFDGSCFDISLNDRGGALDGFGMAIPDRINTCDAAVAGALEQGVPGLEAPPDFLSNLGAANLGILAVEEDGSWYVSPTETLGDAVVQGLRIWDAATLQQFIDWAIDLGSGTNPALSF